METRLLDYYASLAAKATERTENSASAMTAFVRLNGLPDAAVVRRHCIAPHPKSTAEVLRERYLANARARMAKYRASHPNRLKSGRGLRVTQIAECCDHKYRRWRYASGEFPITDQICCVCHQPLKWRTK